MGFGVWGLGFGGWGLGLGFGLGVQGSWCRIQEIWFWVEDLGDSLGPDVMTWGRLEFEVYGPLKKLRESVPK